MAAQKSGLARLDFQSPLGVLELEASVTGISGLRFRESEADVQNEAVPALVLGYGAGDGARFSDEDILLRIVSTSGEGVENGMRCRIHNLRAFRELEAYFAGKLRRFTVALDIQGTEFQIRAWRALCEIPYGETRSYASQAAAAGNPSAARAVGQANHVNPVAIIVPCHRVVGADGTLGGYAGELWRKEFLLALEKTVSRDA